MATIRIRMSNPGTGQADDFDLEQIHYGWIWPKLLQSECVADAKDAPRALVDCEGDDTYRIDREDYDTLVEWHSELYLKDRQARARGETIRSVHHECRIDPRVGKCLRCTTSSEISEFAVGLAAVIRDIDRDLVEALNGKDRKRAHRPPHSR